jgi:DNA helicase IV
VDALAGIPLADRPADQEGKLLHTTIGKFKGLESDIVVMADVDPSDPRCSTRARYVAASRARHMLHVFAKGDWLDGAGAE